MPKNRSRIVSLLAALSIVLVLSALSKTSTAQDISGQLKWGSPPPPRAGACFYKDAGFSGQFFCVASGQTVRQLPPGFNDKISSIRVFGRIRVGIFNDNNFGGTNTSITRDVQNLKNLPVGNGSNRNWNDRISSIRVSPPR